MGQAAARAGDRVEATDTHLQVDASGATAPWSTRFEGVIEGVTSPDVRIGGQPAAVVGSVAVNAVPHLPGPGASFVTPPANTGRVAAGSATVRINGRPAARDGDAAITCNDPVDAPVGTVRAAGPVRIGG